MSVCNCLLYLHIKLIVMMSTASSEEEAKKIAHGLVSKSLVACVNIVPQIQSVYEWEGKVEQSQEYLLIIKVCAVDKYILNHQHFSVPSHQICWFPPSPLFT